LAATHSELEALMQQRTEQAVAREAGARARVAAYAIRTIAAWRVQRAWRSWRRSDAREARLAAVRRVQGAVRAWLGRRATARTLQVQAAQAKVRTSMLSAVALLAPTPVHWNHLFQHFRVARCQQTCRAGGCTAQQTCTSQLSSRYPASAGAFAA
jgi:hypothetical protein